MPRSTWMNHSVLKQREFNGMDMSCFVPVVLRSADGSRHCVYYSCKNSLRILKGSWLWALNWNFQPWYRTQLVRCWFLWNVGMHTWSNNAGFAFSKMKVCLNGLDYLSSFKLLKWLIINLLLSQTTSGMLLELARKFFIF